MKKIDLPLNQIKTMLNDSSLEYAAGTMEDHEQILDDKIKELQQLKSIATDYKECFRNAIENLDVLKIIDSPVMIYSEIEEQNGSVIENLKLFEKITPTCMPLFTFYIDKELFISDMFYNDVMGSRKYFTCGLSLKDKDNLVSKADFNEHCKIINQTKCLTSVIKFYTNKDYSSMNKILDYIKQNNLEVAGTVFLRAISFRNNIKNNYDYYEVYIPLK